MNKFAHAYITKLGFSSKKILPMDGAGPVLSDYVLRSRHPKNASAMIMHHYLNKRAPLKEKEETRASKVLRGGLAGAAIGGLGLGVTGAGAGVYSSLSDVNAAKRIIESRGIEVPDGTDNNTLVRAYVAGSGLGGGLMGGAAGAVGGGALGILYGMIR